MTFFLVLGARFAFGFPKEKDAGHSVRVIIEIPSSAFVAISTSHSRRRQTSEEEESFLVYFVSLSLSFSLSISLSQGVVRALFSDFRYERNPKSRKRDR